MRIGAIQAKLITLTCVDARLARADIALSALLGIPQVVATKVARSDAHEVARNYACVHHHATLDGEIFDRNDCTADMVRGELAPRQYLFAELAHYFCLRAVELNVCLHGDHVLFHVSIALLAWDFIAFNFLMVFDLAKSVNFQTVGVSLAPDLRQVEDRSEFWARLNCLELVATLISLLAVAALAASLLPLLDAWKAINGTLAQSAEHRLLLVWHDHLLTDDAEGVGEERKPIELCLVAYPVLRLQLRRHIWFKRRLF